MPCAAAAAAVAPARLPVEAQASVVSPKARARAAATATTRSLKELVGLRVSYLRYSSPGMPSASASRGPVEPGAQRVGVVGDVQRSQAVGTGVLERGWVVGAAAAAAQPHPIRGRVAGQSR